VFQARAGVGAQVVNHPAPQPVAPVQLQARQLGASQRAVAGMRRADQVEPADKGAQFGGGAQVELGAGIDIQRLVEIVGVDPQPVEAFAAFVQRQAVDHLARIVGPQQPGAGQPQFRDALWFSQGAQEFRHTKLYLGIEGGLSRQVEAIELVEAANIEQGKQAGAGEIYALLASEIGDR